ncbi:MAG: SLC13 family permease, partial [Verrucomicrobiota bacterium]
MLCAWWFITEPIPVAATALIPFALLPFLSNISYVEISQAYGHHLIFLIIGGMLIAKAMEKNGLHRRGALLFIQFLGARGEKRIVLALMLTSAFLSMWMNNAAICIVMLPIASAILEYNSGRPSFRTVLLLGIAYACSIGGIATPLGASSNTLFLSIYNETTGYIFSFEEWTHIGFSIVLILLPLTWIFLSMNLRGKESLATPQTEKWTKGEFRVLLVLLATILVWASRSFWTEPLGSNYLSDSTVALLAGIACFIIPSGRKKGERLLEWNKAKEIPWDLLLLIGSGIAIAKAFNSSGLSDQIGLLLVNITFLHPLLLILCICVITAILTECTSNTGAVNIMLPILAIIAMESGLEPEKLMIPATI